jgi:glyoxylase-like metal-dependent hydrolase (beta-lactamase superfamily II)
MLKLVILSSALMLAACDASKAPAANDAAPAGTTDLLARPASGTPTSIVRLDCGHADFKDMNAFFSDRPGVYPPGSGKVTDSCYLIRHGGQAMLWDTGLPAATKGAPMVQDNMTASIDRTLVEQLAELGVKPADIRVVGISHMHGDHTGQARDFPQARLVIGKEDFEQTVGKDDPFTAWRGAGKPVTAEDSDIDVFGDGDVVALFMPGHTPGHHALLVKLKSGDVLLTGDLYHTTIARQKRAVPGFNTSRDQTLASMDKFEALAKRLNAKVIIQHEPGDIAKLPAFPAAAE